MPKISFQEKKDKLSEKERRELCSVFADYLKTHLPLVAEIGWGCGIFHSDMTYSEFRSFLSDIGRKNLNRYIRLIEEYGPDEYFDSTQDSWTFRFNENKEILGYINVRFFPEKEDAEKVDAASIINLMDLSDWQRDMIENKEVAPTEKALSLVWIYPFPDKAEEDLIKGQIVQGIETVDVETGQRYSSQSDEIPPMYAYFFYLGKLDSVSDLPDDDNAVSIRLGFCLGALNKIYKEVLNYISRRE